jgi:hypothetical protein
MSTGGVIAIVIGAVVVIFLAVNKGLVNSGVAVGHGIIAPQPAQNYGGFLAASTAPQVSNILGTILSGVNSSFHNWLAPATPATPAPAQGASATSPSVAAQPTGPAPGTIQPSSYTTSAGLVDTGMGWMIGPQTTPALGYDATSGAAFDYAGLTADNSFDPNASLMEA